MILGVKRIKRIKRQKVCMYECGFKRQIEKRVKRDKKKNKFENI